MSASPLSVLQDQLAKRCYDVNLCTTFILDIVNVEE